MQPTLSRGKDLLQTTQPVTGLTGMQLVESKLLDPSACAWLMYCAIYVLIAFLPPLHQGRPNHNLRANTTISTTAAAATDTNNNINTNTKTTATTTTTTATSTNINNTDINTATATSTTTSAGTAATYTATVFANHHAMTPRLLCACLTRWIGQGSSFKAQV